MCITEFDEKTFVEGIKKEGREEEREDLVSNMLKSGKEPKVISDFCGIPLDYVVGIREKMGLTSP